MSKRVPEILSDRDRLKNENKWTSTAKGWRQNDREIFFYRRLLSIKRFNVVSNVPRCLHGSTDTALESSIIRTPPPAYRPGQGNGRNSFIIADRISLSNGPFQPVVSDGCAGARERDIGRGEGRVSKNFQFSAFQWAPSTLAPVHEMGYRNEWYSVYSRAKLRCQRADVAPARVRARARRAARCIQALNQK